MKNKETVPDVGRGREDLSVETQVDLLEPVALSPALGQSGATLTTVRGHGSCSTGHLGRVVHSRWSRALEILCSH